MVGGGRVHEEATEMASKHDDPHDPGLRKEPEIGEALGRIARERGWPADLTRCFAELRVPLSAQDSWAWFDLSPEQAATRIRRRPGA